MVNQPMQAADSVVYCRSPANVCVGGWPVDYSLFHRIDSQWREQEHSLEKMPTVLRSGPYRFFFYAGDRDEPPHIHVERENNKAKFWLEPVRLQNSGGFSRTEIGRIQKLVEENRGDLLRGWNEYFNG